MLGYSGSNCLRIITKLLNPVLNPNLSDCSSFLYNASSAKGNVPEFWLWSSYQLNSYHWALKGLTYSNIYNYDEEKFAKFVRDN